MRRGELAALKWKSIDFSRKRIKVVGTRDRYGDKDITKGKYDRTIPMNARLEQLLLTTKPLIASPEDYVFLKPNGVPIDPQHIYRLMNSLSSTVGLTNKIRFHDLRHTCRYLKGTQEPNDPKTQSFLAIQRPKQM
jgi:integrase